MLMVKWFMRKNRRNIVSAALLLFVLFNSACAQIPSGKAYVAEELLVQNSTVLLNNASFVIPLQNLGSLKIASVHFSNQYTAGFDSLLNKYTKVDVFNGNIYNGQKNINPMYTFYAAVERKDLKGFPAGGFQPENALTRQEALRGMTIWAAKVNFEEKEKGSIEVGKYADFVILDKDIMTIKGNALPNVKVLKTYVNGEKVYEKK